MFHYVRSGFEHKCGVPSEGLPGLTAEAAAFIDADNAAAYVIGTCRAELHGGFSHGRWRHSDAASCNVLGLLNANYTERWRDDLNVSVKADLWR